MEMLLQERSMFMMLEEVGYELVRLARKACSELWLKSMFKCDRVPTESKDAKSNWSQFHR